MIYFRRVAAAHEDGCVHAMHCKFEILQQWKHLISRLSSSHSAFSLEKPCSPRLNILTSRLVRKNWTKQRSTLNLNTTDLAARSLALLLFRAYTVSQIWFGWHTYVNSLPHEYSRHVSLVHRSHSLSLSFNALSHSWLLWFVNKRAIV